MSSTVSVGCASLGSDPLAHMGFLIHSPQRVLALRLALTRVIGANSIVLDAGCGALGLLAIMAAKLGAARVVAVELGDLDLAKSLAAENDVSDRIDFIQGNLEDVHLPIRTFDVLLGMIYNNEPGRDLSQQQLVQGLIERHAHRKSVFIPNKVRYSLAAYDYPALDTSNSKRRIEWETHILNVESQAGMTFSAVRAVLNRANLPSVDRTPIGRPVWNRLGCLDRSNMTLLSERQLFTEIDYAARSDATSYPETVSLRIAHPGRFSVVVWQQDLVYEDILIRSTESLNRVTPTQLVEPGDMAVLSTGAQWKDSVAMRVEKRPVPAA